MEADYSSSLERRERSMPPTRAIAGSHYLPSGYDSGYDARPQPHSARARLYGGAYTTDPYNQRMMSTSMDRGLIESGGGPPPHHRDSFPSIKTGGRAPQAPTDYYSGGKWILFAF